MTLALLDKFMLNQNYNYKYLSEELITSWQLTLAGKTKTIKEKINYAEAVIFLKNIASQKCFEKAGFVKELHPDGDCYVFKYKK